MSTTSETTTLSTTPKTTTVPTTTTKSTTPVTTTPITTTVPTTPSTTKSTTPVITTLSTTPIITTVSTTVSTTPSTTTMSTTPSTTTMSTTSETTTLSTTPKTTTVPTTTTKSTTPVTTTPITTTVPTTPSTTKSTTPVITTLSTTPITTTVSTTVSTTPSTTTMSTTPETTTSTTTPMTSTKQTTVPSTPSTTKSTTPETTTLSTTPKTSSNTSSVPSTPTTTLYKKPYYSTAPPHPREDILTILIGGCDHKISVTEINSYHPDGISAELPPSPFNTCARPMGVFYNHHIVVCGGGFEGEGTPCFKTGLTHPEWKPFAPMIEHRERFTMNVVGDKIVVIGGFKAGCDIEVFNGEVWEEGPPLSVMHGVVHHCSVSYQESKVMVIGGLVDGSTTDLVQTVDIGTGEISFIASLNSHRYSDECAKVEWNMEKYIFVAGGFEDYRISNTVEYLKENGGEKWISVASMNIRRFNFGLSVYGSQIAAFGGEPTIH